MIIPPDALGCGFVPEKEGVDSIKRIAPGKAKRRKASYVTRAGNT